MKVRTHWHFTKWDGLNKVFLIQYIYDVLIIFAALHVFFYIFLLNTENKTKKILSPANSVYLELRNIILFLTWGFFFQMVLFTTLLWRCPTLWKSRLKMATLFRRCLTRSSRHGNRKHWFDVAHRCKFQRWHTQRCSFKERFAVPFLDV